MIFKLFFFSTTSWKSQLALQKMHIATIAAEIIFHFWKVIMNEVAMLSRIYM